MHVSDSVASALAQRGRSGASRPPVKLLPVNHHQVHPTPSQQEYASSDSSYRWGGSDWLHLIERLVPAVRWLRTYDVDNYLKADLIAGITVGTMVVPQVHTLDCPCSSCAAALVITLDFSIGLGCFL
ncbi:unnamed protein product [Sphagnum tenellum]